MSTNLIALKSCKPRCLSITHLEPCGKEARFSNMVTVFCNETYTTFKRAPINSCRAEFDGANAVS